MFKDGATFQQYVNSLRKACYVLRRPLDWSTRAVVHTCYGMRLAGDNKIRFPNFIRSTLVWKIIKSEGPKSEMAILAYVAFLFAFRVPSEALLIKRAHKHDEIDLFTPQKEKVLIARRELAGGKGAHS